MNVDAKMYSLGTRRKETDNPVLISWIRKINQAVPKAFRKAAETKQILLASTAI